MPLIRNEIKLLLREADKNIDTIGLCFHGYDEHEIAFKLNNKVFVVHRFQIEIFKTIIPSNSILESFYVYYYFRKFYKYIKYNYKNVQRIERNLLLKAETKFLTDKAFSDKVNSIINK